MAFAIWSSLFGSGVLLARNFKDITLKRRRRRWGNLFHKSQIMCSVWRSGGAGGLGCVLLQKRRKSCLRRLWSQKWHVRETWVKNESITTCPCKQGWGRRRRRGVFQGASSEKLLESSGNWGTNTGLAREQSKEHWEHQLCASIRHQSREFPSSGGKIFHKSSWIG